jgi:Flp pilus assembly protein TadD
MVWAQQSGAPPSGPSSSSSDKSDSTKQQQKPNLAPPRSDRVQVDDLGSDLGQSSSKDTQEDLSAPENDEKTHPKSSTAVAEADAGTSGGSTGISEFHAWDPHKAAKSVEVGDFYFKRKNYKAAEERYREALGYKENDAVATIRLAICLEKLNLPDDARQEYESYLKILPRGPESEQVQKAIDRLKTQAGAKGP